MNYAVYNKPVEYRIKTQSKYVTLLLQASKTYSPCFRFILIFTINLRMVKILKTQTVK